jgi:hemolysin-activating ACP:hemolysin acyltransferase
LLSVNIVNTRRKKTVSQMTDLKKNSTKSKKANDVGSEAPFDPVAGKSVAEIFGEIVWLLSQDKDARELSIKELEWLVMPPILLKQFHITYARIPDGLTTKGEPVHQRSETKPRLQPVAVELFAMCSEAVASALETGTFGKTRLSISDWRSGSNRRTVYRSGGGSLGRVL